jgi:phage-related protein
VPLGAGLGGALAGSARVEITPDLGKFHADTEKQMTGTLGRIGQVAAGVFAGILGAAVVGKVVGGFKSIVSSGIEMNASLETSTLMFTTLMGNADVAQQHVKGLFDFAAKTPFETGPIITASKHLQVFGGAALNTQESLTLVGDAAAAVGQPIDEVAFWVGRAYSMIQGGKPFGEAAMRLQEMGVMSPQVREEMEKLQASGATATEVWAAMERQLGTFGGAMIMQATSWKGLTSTMMDVFKMTAGEVTGPLFDAVKRLMVALLEFTETPAWDSIIEKTTSVFGFIGTLIDGITRLISGEGGFSGALGGMSEGFGAVIPLVAGLLTGFNPLVMVVKLLIPIFAAVIEALMPLLPVVLQLISTLLPPLANIMQALQPIIASLIPPILQVINAFLPLLPIVAQLIFALLPVLVQILNLVAGTLRMLAPYIAEVARIFSGVLSGAIQVAIAVVSRIVGMFEATSSALRTVIGWVSSVIGWFQRLASTISSIRLPSWLVGRSPSGLELSLRGIRGAMHGVVGEVDQARRAFGALSQPAFGVPLAGAGAGLGASITVNARTDASARDIAHEIAWSLKVGR